MQAMVKKSSSELIGVERATKLNDMDLNDLCDATIDTMRETLGFNIGTKTIKHMEKAQIQSYWEGALLVPEIELFVGRLEGTVAGSLQLIKPSVSNQTSAFCCRIKNHFVAPWARGHGLSTMLLQRAEEEAKMLGYSLIRLSVRETRQSAINAFEKNGYIRWGVLPKYELDQGKIVAGYFYYKEI